MQCVNRRLTAFHRVYKSLFNFTEFFLYDFATFMYLSQCYSKTAKNEIRNEVIKTNSYKTRLTPGKRHSSNYLQ